MTRTELVSQEEVERISALSPAHRLTVQHFIETGRWIIVDDQSVRSKRMTEDPHVAAV